MMSSMKALNISDAKKNESASAPNSHGKSDAENWEHWVHLKLSAYHGRKLTKRNFKPYHPKVEERTFFLHELDKYDFEPEEKWFIVMRTFKKLFGSIASSDTSKGRKFNTKLSFLRERGKQHLLAGKPIAKLIAFPESYWEAYKQISENGAESGAVEPKRKKRQRLETIPEDANTTEGVQLRKRSTAK